MQRERQRRFAFEHGLFLAFAAGVLLMGYGYLDRPPPVESHLRDARSELGEADVRRPADMGRTRLDLPPMRADIFALPELTERRRLAVNPPKPKVPVKPPDKAPPKPPNKVPVPAGQVKLPVKPQPKTPEASPEDPEAPTADRPEPFPLDVVVILRPEGDARRIVVKPVAGGAYVELREGDEYRVSAEEIIKVLEITFTAVTFERQDGTVVTVDKDPLHAYKPLLRDEAAAGNENNPEADFPEYAPGPDAPAVPGAPGAPSRRLTQEELNDIMRRMKEDPAGFNRMMTEEQQ